MRATMVHTGMWEVKELGKYYGYRVYCKAKGEKWKVYKRRRDIVEGIIPVWVLVTDGQRAKSTAVEYAIEEAGRDDQAGGRLDRSESKKTPVSDLLENIDDGIDLDNEGRG